jgi:hypothetical protein
LGFGLTCEYGCPEWWYDENLRDKMKKDIQSKTIHRRKPKTNQAETPSFRAIRTIAHAQATTASSTTGSFKCNDSLRGDTIIPTSDDNHARPPSKKRKCGTANDSDDSDFELQETKWQRRCD